MFNGDPRVNSANLRFKGVLKVSGQVLIYFSWSRPEEIAAPMTIIDDRFPAIFELRRLFYPKFEQLANPAQVDQGIGGFLDHVQKPNFTDFAEQASALTGRAVRQVERVADNGQMTLLDATRLSGVDTIIVISFDSFRTSQAAQQSEMRAVREFLSDPNHLIAICPHHDIGDTDELPPEERDARRASEHFHHGDKAIPPRQGFGGFARTLLAGLGTPVLNRYGLRPAATTNDTPEPIDAERTLDRLDLLAGVETFNLHPHLPQLERVGESVDRMEVLARQRIDMSAPAHPFTQNGRQTFDALLQSRAGLFAGTILVSDTTLWSSTAGGLHNLRRFWSNLVQRPRARG
jgi:hypothetical protein